VRDGGVVFARVGGGAEEGRDRDDFDGGRLAVCHGHSEVELVATWVLRLDAWPKAECDLEKMRDEVSALREMKTAVRLVGLSR
jgi:hypothetical protein